MTTTRLLVVLVLVLVVGGYTSWTAGRLDRLHARVDAGWAALDAALVRRAASARVLSARLPAGQPAATLEGASTAALVGGPVGREGLENDLTAALRAARAARAAEGVGVAASDAWADVDTATSRVQLSRSFHNTAVANARAQRRRWFVRYLHLAGHRVMPRPFDIDDGDL